MTEMYSGGDSLREISRVFGCAESTVGRTLRRYGVEIRPLGGIAGRPRDIPKSALMGRRIQFLYHDCKLNQREVAEVLGVAPGTVGWYMKHLDIPRRSRSENAMLRSRPPRNVVMERLRTLTAA